MVSIRDFSSSEGSLPLRNIDNDAPQAMRQELVDLTFQICEQLSQWPSPRHIYQVSCQNIGVQASGNPAAGYRHALGRDIARVEWQRVYDLVCRLWPEFETQGLGQRYREGVNRILSGYGVVWELDASGRLRRVLPNAAQAQIDATAQELSQPRFEAALRLFNDARNAYDDRPRRDRDACANMFDSMESVAKEVFSMPQATFGGVLSHIRQTQGLHSDVVTVLEGINTLRNRNFGHGMTSPFNLKPAEVDFTYLSCVAGVLLFTRLSHP